MSFLNTIKKIAGFSDSESPQDADNQERGAYINPFKPAKPEETATAKSPETEKPAEAKTEADLDSAVNAEIIDNIIRVMNTTVPDYVKGCIDKEAQTRYVESLLGTSLTKYTAEVKRQCREAARMEWQADRMNMEHKMAASTKQLAEATAKTDEQKNRLMSLERQKIALNERIGVIEAKAATAEAEKEQFQLECKSLMNKLKVAAVNDADSAALKEDCARLNAELENMKNAAKTAAARQEEDSRLIAELRAENDSLKAEMAKTAADNGISSIQALNDEIALLNGNVDGLKKREEASAKTIMEMREALENRNAEISRMKEQSEKTLSEAGEKLAAKESECDALSGEIALLKQEMAEKNASVKELSNTAKELTEIVRQLQSTIDSNKKSYAASEEKLRQEIALLQKEKEERLAEEKKETKKRVELSFGDEPAAPQKPAKTKEAKTKQSGKISAIDYTTEYTDWLMPTPPTASIPIDEAAEEPEAYTAKPAKKEQAQNPNAPSQMELFT